MSAPSGEKLPLLKDGPLALEGLARGLRTLDDMLVRCMRCGFCQAACPVYLATMREADVARGKLALVENLAFGLSRDPDAVNDRLHRCLLCGSCEKNCPSGVRITDVFILARSLTASYLGLGPLKRLVFRQILPRPRLFETLARVARFFQRPFLRPAGGDPRTFSVPLLRPVLGERRVPRLAADPPPGEESLRIPRAARGLPRAAFFPGCVPDKIFPGIVRASLKVLARHGAGFFIPRERVCCGLPLLSAGDREGFLRLVKRNLRAFREEKFDYLVTPCASCASAVRVYWPRFSAYFAGEDLKSLLFLAENAYDATSFLTRVLKADFPPSPKDPALPRVVYHDPCHLRKSLGVFEEPRIILKSLPGHLYREAPGAERCCGNGGSFNLAHYDLSFQIARRKRADLISVSPRVAATTCPACMLQLMDVFSREGDAVEVRHVIELYADSM
ncbi:MAG: (Fe-S)-binding protein [Deltaproteobacteria bacterium]|jgi:glycolate oxidase iron-sulfur subunit|nr:(Fe-S)-binding protein [Deltaproteobacteria bacterium]